MLADCALDQVFTLADGNNVILKLNSQTVTGTVSNGDKLSGSLAVDTGAALTIEGEGKYTYTNNGYAGITVEGTLNILSGTFEVTKSQARVLHAKTGGEINISGGTFIVNNTTSQHVHADGVVNISSTPHIYWTCR